MTRAALFLIFCLILTSSFGCAGRRASSDLGSSTISMEVRDRIESLNAAMEDAFRDNDMLRVASFYADNGILMAPDGNRTVGRDAIDAYWTRFGARGTDHDWQLTVDRIDGDRGFYVQRGTSTITMTRDNGELGVSFVDFVLIWETQEDGSLKIAVDGYW